MLITDGDYLDNSNTDWRQGWKALQAWQAQTGKVFYFPDSSGYTDLEDYSVQSIPLPEVELTSARLRYPKLYFYPPPGFHIVSANRMRKNQFAWFRYRSPEDIIAHTLFYYEVPELQHPWIAQCSVPTAPLNQDAIQVGFDEIIFRSLVFDCTQTWVYPEGGRTIGWYVLHDQLLAPEGIWHALYLRSSQPNDTFMKRHMISTIQNFRQSENNYIPAFAMFQWDAQPIAPSYTVPYYLDVAETAPADLERLASDHTKTLMSSTSSGESLHFLGMRKYVNQSSLDIETWWQVGENLPTTRPFSVMAHLVTPQGKVREVADGLGVSPLILEAGDIFVQRHQFADFTSQDWLRTGIYWLDDGARWRIDEGADAIFIPISP